MCLNIRFRVENYYDFKWLENTVINLYTWHQLRTEQSVMVRNLAVFHRPTSK
jgi:hypothetical protein